MVGILANQSLLHGGLHVHSPVHPFRGTPRRQWRVVMKILAIEHELPGVSPADFTPELKSAEARRVWELHQADIIREVYFRQDCPEAVLVLE